MQNSLGKESADPLKYPEWQGLLQEALVEIDREKLKACVAAAEAAIFNRLRAISQSPNQQAERNAIADAIAILRLLKRDDHGLAEGRKESA